MKSTAWRWLVLLLIPGCLLVQPLDEAKPDVEGSAGGAGRPSQTAGSAGNHTGGSAPGTAGSGGTGNRGGSGPLPSAGAANGGAASGGDFSLFLGDWTLVGGQSIITCDGGLPQTKPVMTGGIDTFGLGTISDLIFDPGTTCEILADVNNRSASLNPATSSCSYTDTDGYSYDLTFDTFLFVVLGNGQTATASMTSTVDAYDADDNYVSTCDATYSWDYAR